MRENQYPSQIPQCLNPTELVQMYRFAKNESNNDKFECCTKDIKSAKSLVYRQLNM